MFLFYDIPGISFLCHKKKAAPGDPCGLYSVYL